MNKKYDIPEDALLIILGVPGSGKSTLANNVAKENKELIISKDEIAREMFGTAANPQNDIVVFEEFYKRIEENLKSGKMAIADATSMGESSRQNLYEIALRNNRPIRIALLNVSLERAIAQNSQREGDHRVPLGLIKSMYNRLEKQYGKIEEEIEQFPNAKICDMFLSEQRSQSSTALER